MQLYKKYIADEKNHIHHYTDEIRNVFEDALIMQRRRILNNIMSALKCSREKAMYIAFYDIEKNLDFTGVLNESQN